MPLADSHRGSSSGFESLFAISAIKELFGDLLRNWPQKKQKNPHKQKRASSQALPRATSPSDRADAPWMALSWLQAFAALFRDPSAPIKDTPSPQPVQERGWACAPQPLLGTVSPSVSFLCCTFTESAVHNGKPRGYVVHVTGCRQ